MPNPPAREIKLNSNRPSIRRWTLATALLGLVVLFISVDSFAADLSYRVSPARYKVRDDFNVRVRMRDGVEIAVRITRPDAEGPFPALMSYSPYRALYTFKAANSDSEYSSKVHAPHYFAERGYVFVSFDVRGTGGSSGSSADMYSDAERQDGYDMVEWIASQSWSTGSVALWGFSYSGVAALQVAAMNPPALKAVIVGSATDDVYSDWMYPGGSPRSQYMFGSFASLMAAFNFAPPEPGASQEQWSKLWEQRLATSIPWSMQFLDHQTNDGYWQARSVRPDYSRIKCPVFIVGGWADWYPTAALRLYSELDVPKRILIGPWAHYWPEDGQPQPRVDARPEYLKWLDHFLKGVDTGLEREPPVTLFVQNYAAPAAEYDEQPGFWRQETQWPIARTRHTPMYLGAEGQLETKPSAEAADSYRYRASVGAANGLQGTSPAADQRPDEVYSLTYTSPLLETDTEVTGTPAVNLFVKSSADVAYFHVRLSDVAPDGSSRLISDAGLNATRWRSHSRPERLQPGKVYELKFNLESTAYVFPAGHRIRVSIASADFQNAWPTPKAAINTIMKGPQFPSRIILPVVPPPERELPRPVLLTSPNTVVKNPVGAYELAYDRLQQLTTVKYSGGMVSSQYRISDENPAEASVEATMEYILTQPDGEVRINARTVTTSDEQFFRHRVHVDIQYRGQHQFSKEWASTVPRNLN